jgi:hypothetical protein
MSKRRERAAPARGGGSGEVGSGQRDAAAAPARHGGRLLPQLALLIVVFAVTVGVAELAGAANLGVSFGIGQVVFAVTLVVLLIRA